MGSECLSGCPVALGSGLAPCPGAILELSPAQPVLCQRSVNIRWLRSDGFRVWRLIVAQPGRGATLLHGTVNLEPRSERGSSQGGQNRRLFGINIIWCSICVHDGD